MRPSNDWPQAPSDSHACPTLLLLDLHLKLFPVMYRIKINDDDDDVERTYVLGCQDDILGTNCDQCLSMVQCCFTSTKTVRLIWTKSLGWPPQLSRGSWIRMTESRSMSRSRLWLTQDPGPDPGYDWIKIQVQIQVMTESRSSSRSRLSAAGTWICESAVPTYGNCVTGLLPIKAHAI